uniref:NAD-dependent epimerase/dehydratase family protein n=1 Tax=Flavobacterium sp. TaxID=239 RepID=UPI00286AA9A5
MSKINFNNNNIQYIYGMILVTGATGLLGSHLVLHLLEKGENVRAIFRNELGKSRVRQVFEHYNKWELFEKINWCESDILHIPSLEMAFNDIEIVYHCAALISFDTNDEEALRKANIEGTANVVNLCLDFKIKKICYVSSIAALGDLAVNENIISEETEWNPEKSHSDYAISKYGAEMEVWRAYQEGLQVVIVNPGVILGQLFWAAGSGDIYQKVKRGLSFYTQGSSGFVTVTDVAKIMHLLMQSSVSGEKFILISENKTYQDLVFKIADQLNVPRPKYYASKLLMSFGWKMDWFLNIFFGKKRL